MKLFKLTNLFLKKDNISKNKLLSILRKKEPWYATFIMVIILVYLANSILSSDKKKLHENLVVLSGYDESLKANINESINDSMVNATERKRLLNQIENKIVHFLYEIPDYSYFTPLETYLQLYPKLLDEIPSCSPLEKGGYYIGSKYGYRVHPITKDVKKHYGLDFAASKDTHVYATASGTIISVKHSKTGYGTHIIIKHRFGFETLYGHLTKVLVTKGQYVDQHQLIGTVGSSGASTGNHLHYEVVKNKQKIDPIPSLNQKKNILKKLISNN